MADRGALPWRLLPARAVGAARRMSAERVECHSGFTYAERPTALHWEGQRLVIDQVEDSWRIPGGRRFRVRVEDGRRFELFYGELYDEWRIHAL